MSGGDGNDSLYMQSAGRAVLLGGNGNDWLGSNGAQNVLVGGDGNDFLGASGGWSTLAGGAGNDTVFAVGSTNTMDGGDGDDFVGVSGNTNALVGGAGNDYVGATGNNNDLDGGFGNDTLEAAAGHTGDRFIYHAGYGQDQIIGFCRAGGGGTDIVNIQGFGLADFAALQPFMSQSGADTVITLNGADILTIRNVLPSELLATDFQLG